jgi:chaperone modulatory protein CbpM
LDLIGRHIEPLGQFHQRLLAADSGGRHLGLVSRTMVPASSRHDISCPGTPKSGSYSTYPGRWLAPQIDKDQRQFRDADLAGAWLILDLAHGMGVNQACIDVIMDLVDQFHGFRMVMRDLISAVLQRGSSGEATLAWCLGRIIRSPILIDRVT